MTAMRQTFYKFLIFLQQQKNAWARDGDLTKRPREDQNSCGVLVVSWSNFLSKPKCHLVVLVVLVVLWTTRPREHHKKPRDLLASRGQYWNCVCPVRR